MKWSLSVQWWSDASACFHTSQQQYHWCPNYNFPSKLEWCWFPDVALMHVASLNSRWGTERGVLGSLLQTLRTSCPWQAPDSLGHCVGPQISRHERQQPKHFHLIVFTFSVWQHQCEHSVCVCVCGWAETLSVDDRRRQRRKCLPVVCSEKNRVSLTWLL